MGKEYWTPVPEAMWTAKTKIYLCPYVKACLGDYTSSLYSYKFKSNIVDVWRQSNDDDPSAPLCNYEGSNDPNSPLYNLCCDGEKPSKTKCAWGDPKVWKWKYGYTGSKCNSKKGYTGVVCATCRTDEGDHGHGF